MRSRLKSRAEVEAVGRDAPGFFLYGLQSHHNTIKCWKQLDEVADVIHRSFNASRYPEHEFYHIGVPNVDAEQGVVATVERLKGKDIKGGKTVFRGGDIIFARIEPSIYNKKTAIVPDIGDCLGSTEFIAARPKEGTNVNYLLWVLRSKWIAQQITGKMTGSTGRRRFEDTDFAKLMIPWVEELEAQEYIAKMLLTAQSRYLRLMREAIDTLEECEKSIVSILENALHPPPVLALEKVDIDLLEDKWSDMEKLFLPKSAESQMEQMQLSL